MKYPDKYLCLCTVHFAESLNLHTQQAKHNNYKNTKLKVLKTNAAIWFNKLCKLKHLKQNYINVKINGRKPQDKKTTINAIRYRINQEIKFLYRKKQHLNQRLYYLRVQLEGAHQYKCMWQHLQEYIDEQISRLMDNLYQKLNKVSALVGMPISGLYFISQYVLNCRVPRKDS